MFQTEKKVEQNKANVRAQIQVFSKESRGTDSLVDKASDIIRGYPVQSPSANLCAAAITIAEVALWP